MGLIKECRCGKLIDYSLKYCSECEHKVKKDKKITTAYYDNYIRDKKSKELYNSKRWHILTEACKHRFKGLDIYAYYILGTIEYGSICHHIEEVKTNDSRRYDINNLIYLSSTNHNVIHGLYAGDYEGTKKMLFDLMNQWEKVNR